MGIPHNEGMTEHEFTAHRVQKGSKFQVIVKRNGVEVDRIGGKRAERAQAVILAAWRGRDLGVYGARSDADAAVTEAHRIATATTQRHRGHVLACTPADRALAVMVEEGAA